MTAPDSPDRLARLWAPWRAAYVSGDPTPSSHAGRRPRDDRGDQACVLCALGAATAEQLREALVLDRGATVYAVLNAYPYNPGHLMIVPYRHVDGLAELTEQEADELWRMTRAGVEVITTAMGADGVNLGMNLGRASGAGIADHLHQHVVPRWAGDTNFMTTTGASSRVLPQALEEVYDRLAPAFQRTSGARR